MRRLSIVALLSLIACGGTDNSGPSSSANVSGIWSASVSNMSGGGISCSSSAPTALTLNQTGSTFSGSYSGGELTCSGPGGTSSGPVGTGSVINGTVSGNSV